MKYFSVDWEVNMSEKQMRKLAALYTRVASERTREWIRWAVQIAYASAAVAEKNEQVA